jgi:hypothetical protein
MHKPIRLNRILKWLILTFGDEKPIFFSEVTGCDS